MLDLHVLGVACLISQQRMSVKRSSELIYVGLVKNTFVSEMRLGIIKIQGKLILLPQMPLLNLQVKAVIGNGLQVEFDAYTD